MVGTLTISAGAKKIQVQTTDSTKFRRYSGDSVKFEDAKPGTLAQIQVGDQLRVRGTKSEDGSTIQAEEVVSGSFKNLAGTIATINAAGGTLTLKDLTTKKTMTVMVTANSDVRKLPPEIAARFAARAKGGAAGGPGGGPRSEWWWTGCSGGCGCCSRWRAARAWWYGWSRWTGGGKVCGWRSVADVVQTSYGDAG